MDAVPPEIDINWTLLPKLEELSIFQRLNWHSNLFIGSTYGVKVLDISCQSSGILQAVKAFPSLQKLKVSLLRPSRDAYGVQMMEEFEVEMKDFVESCNMWELQEVEIELQMPANEFIRSLSCSVRILPAAAELKGDAISLVIYYLS